MSTKAAQYPAQYDYGGYEQALDTPELGNLGYLPGVAPTQPSQQGSWALPALAVAGGLTGLMALRGAKRGIGKLLQRRAAARAPKTEPWNWDMEMLGRQGKQYQSMLHPGESLGHGYGPGPEAIVKTSSVDIISALRRIAEGR